MATMLYVRSGGADQVWHIIRHPPRREDPVWSHRPALCGAYGTGTPWSSQASWYEHVFIRQGLPLGKVCPYCQEHTDPTRPRPAPSGELGPSK
jgi:hypothetical protein